MTVRYRLIRIGAVIGEQTKELDGDTDTIKRVIMSDVYDGMDPLVLAKNGKPTDWIEATCDQL